MKIFRIILPLLLLFSCNQKDYDNSDLIFSIRKYINTNQSEIGTPQNVDLSSIRVDSVIKYAKHLYLESELNSKNKHIDYLIQSLKNSQQDKYRNLVVLDYQKKELDSLKKVYDETSIDIYYYKVYTQLKKNQPDTINYRIVNGHIVKEDSLVWHYNTMFLANEKLDIIDCPIDLNLNLTEEIEKE
jgi:hypothetical protein